jgi:hypothetical protein
MMSGKAMCQVFEIKSKSKQLTLSSNFPRNKIGQKISPTGSLLPSTFVSKKTPSEIFEAVLSEFKKVLEPLLFPDPQQLKIVAAYYKVRPV